MRIVRIAKHRLRSVLRQSRADWDLDRELDLHIEQLAKEYMAAGMAESEALVAARRDFGPVTRTKEECRDMRRVNLIEDLGRDLAFAFRGLSKSPAFTLTALLSLALGIGANTAIYSFMDTILMRALPVPDPQNLAIFNWRAKGWPKVAHSQHGEGYDDPGGVAVSGTFPYPFFETVGDHSDTFTSIFAFAAAGRPNLIAGKQAFLGDGEYVSGNYFRAIGAPPAAGRLIDEGDDRPGAAGVVVISYRVWQQRFNGAPNAMGQNIFVNHKPFTIAGVTAPEFYGVNLRYSPDIFLPLHCLSDVDPRARGGDWFHERNTYWVEMMGRLRPGISLRQAETEMATQFHVFVASTAANSKERANLPALWMEEGGSGIDSLRRTYSKPLYVLFGMTSLILAITCANMANLLLSHATTRRREMAVRLSLGAGRWRIIRQLMTESVLLAVSGGLIGLVVAGIGIRFLTRLLADGQESFALQAGIDGRILLFSISLSVAAGIVFGLAPAIQGTNVDVAPALKESRTGALRVRRFGWSFGLSHALLTGQVALSVLLVVAAGLFVRTLVQLHSVSIGFNPEKLLVFNLDAGAAGYDERHRAIFYEDLRRRFEATPGVRAATMTDIPLVAGPEDSESITVPNLPAPPDRPLRTNVVVAGPSFFKTMQVPILLGRAISGQDTRDASRVVVVNEAFAKRFFAGRSIIGQHFAFSKQDVQIVGLAKNTLYSSLKSVVPPVAYVPWSQALPGWSPGEMYYEIRTAGDPLGLADTVRQVVYQADSHLPVAGLTTQVRYIDSTIASERSFADLCTCFGLLALLIACVGLYGTMTNAVARRTNEIGIRLALGAQRRNVIWMVQREVLMLSAAGLAIGLGVAFESAQLVESFLFKVRATDPIIFGLSAIILMVCALAAGFAPAWRASRIDPMEALRNE